MHTQRRRIAVAARKPRYSLIDHRVVVHAGRAAGTHNRHGGQPGRLAGAWERARKQWLRSGPPGLLALPAAVREQLAQAPHMRRLRSVDDGGALRAASVSGPAGQPTGRPQPATRHRTRLSGASGQGTARTATGGALPPPQPPCASAAPPLRLRFPGQFGPNSGLDFPAIYRRRQRLSVGVGSDFPSATAGADPPIITTVVVTTAIAAMMAMKAAARSRTFLLPLSLRCPFRAYPVISHTHYM